MCDNAKDKKSNEKNIVFFFGAGCEGKYQFDLPSGADFKRETILAKDAKALYDFLNDNSDYSPPNGCLLHYNSTNILYQTLLEEPTLFNFNRFSKRNKKYRTHIQKYVELKNKGEKVGEYGRIFKKIYTEEFYNKIISGNYQGYNCTKFLEKACFYTYVDSLFNYIRKPDLYKTESQKVMSFYYSAYMCMLKKMMLNCNCHNKKEIKDILHKSDSVSNRETLMLELNNMQTILVRKYAEDNNKELYYKKIHNMLSEQHIKVVTTNYTMFSQQMLNLNDDSIAYIHGRMDWFEDLKTKSVKPINQHSKDAVIFPFIFAQSAVKPIVSPLQIKEYYKANKFMEQATEIIVLGYNFNSDDEHIVNMFREFICKEKKITFLYYVESDADDEKERNAYKTNLDKLFGENNGISLVNTKDIDSELIRIFKDCNKN